jgi:hypothetical protein
VLFSNDQVAAAINRWFEPVWDSVRPVPIVRIDFGNGTVVTRTLHGNIASYVCAADGQVFDILPGIYEPNSYVDRLNQLRLLANYVDRQGKDQRDARLREYHQGHVEALEKNEVAPHFINLADMRKRAVEGRLEAVLVRGGAAAVVIPPVRSSAKSEPAKLDSPEELANWKLLAEDTKHNETVRRLAIHASLLKRGVVQPENLTRWLYKEVLHADLDDPYLGLGNALFASYPFAKEETPRKGQ